jgi:hypothetical protein
MHCVRAMTESRPISTNISYPTALSITLHDNGKIVVQRAFSFSLLPHINEASMNDSERYLFACLTKLCDLLRDIDRVKTTVRGFMTQIYELFSHGRSFLQFSRPPSSCPQS